DEVAASYQRGILKESRRIADIVRNLLTFSRRSDGGFGAARVEDLFDAALGLLGRMLQRDQIAVAVECPRGSLPPVRCRPQEIEQVLINLIANARHALNTRYPGGHPDKRLSLIGRSARLGDQPAVALQVWDGGIGIPEALRGRIFDPFFTTKRA